MSLMEIFLIGIGLSMDAFAVAICKGLSMQKVDLRYTVWIALYFGVFQAAMPLTGWLLGSQFARHVTRFAPWIAFILLALIGGNMIRESLSKDEEEAEREERLTVDHNNACCGDQYRRAGRRCVVFDGGDLNFHRRGGHPHRMHDVCHFACGCVHRQCLRREV